jgi:hypothetical protein
MNTLQALIPCSADSCRHLSQELAFHSYLCDNCLKAQPLAKAGPHPMRAWEFPAKDGLAHEALEGLPSATT